MKEFGLGPHTTIVWQMQAFGAHCLLRQKILLAQQAHCQCQQYSSFHLSTTSAQTSARAKQLQRDHFPEDSKKEAQSDSKAETKDQCLRVQSFLNQTFSGSAGKN
jgi:hypothetical protein